MTTSYWQKRSEQIARKQHQKADDFEKRASRQYKRAAKSIKEDLESFYARYADANGITMAQTKRLLSKEELGNFKMTLEEFREKALANQDGRWTKELDSIYIRSRISRLQALQTQIRGHLNELGHEQARTMTGLLGDVYKDAYYRTLHQIQTGTGVGVSFARINDAALDKVLNKPWAGSNFSRRIWKDKRKLQTELERVVSNSFIRGDSLDKTIRAFQGKMDVSQSNAERIIQSEVAFFTEQASAAGYSSSGVVEKYEILATLDGRTSSTCRSKDGKVFPVSEMVVGETYPPFHARCRTTTVPFFDDEWFKDGEERAARGEDGKTYYVPADMKYDEWKKEYVDSPKPQKKDILNGDSHFRSIMDMTEATQEYKDALTERYDSGSDAAKRVFEKYVTVNAVNDSNFKQGAHYSPMDQVVNMDFAADMKNPRGRGATYFHEFGHYVDNMAAIKIKGRATYDGVCHMDLKGIKSDDFKKAILRDVQDYMQNYSKDKGIDLRQTQLELSKILAQGDGALHSAISDIYGGVTRRRIQGKYGHSPKYWQQLPNAIEKESFAHMFEANFDPTGKRAELMKEFLPKSFALFQKILEEI